MKHEQKIPYVPHVGIEYPDKPDEHIKLRADVKSFKKVELHIDEHYPFLDKSFGFRVKSALLYLGIFTLVFFLAHARFGLRIEGRAILKKHKALFRNGAITASNHVLRWDLLHVLQAIRYRRLYLPVWTANLSGPDGGVIRLVGGVPVPSDIHTIKYFNAAFDELHAKGKWFHVFPESCNWHYYQPIRPFKKGMFTMAYKYQLPVIPMAFSYRPATGLFRLFKKKNYPLITLRIGDPIMPDMTLPRKEAVTRLRAECHRRIVELAGITDNIWPCEGD